MRDSDYRADRMIAALLSRKARLESLLAMTNETRPRDMWGRAPFLIVGAERGRLEDELRHVKEVLELALQPQ